MALDDKIQRWASYGVIAFNVTVIIMMIIYSFARTGGMAGLHFGDFIISLVLAAISGGVVFLVSMKLQL